MQAFVHIAEIGKAGQESKHEDKIISARVYIYDLLLGEPGMGRDKGYILAELAAVADELQRIEAGASVDAELLKIIEMITMIMDGMKGAAE